MFIWDFNVIVALGITLSLGLVIAAWMFYTLDRGRKEMPSRLEFFRQCVFCGYLYFDYFKKMPCCCPRCGSYK
jgi:hypothetical protein